MHRAIFLDRDGVINAMVYHPEHGLIDSPSNPTEFHLLPGVAKAIRHINEMGFLTIVISNQPGVAKGKYTTELLKATTEKMHGELAKEGARLDAVYYCQHHPDAKLDEYRQVCDCRKPKPGLLLQAAVEWQLNLPDCYFLGDGVTDVLAGQRAGCQTFLVNSRKCYICDELSRQAAHPDFIVPDLMEGIQVIANLEKGEFEKVSGFRYGCSQDVNLKDPLREL